MMIDLHRHRTQRRFMTFLAAGLSSATTRQVCFNECGQRTRRRTGAAGPGAEEAGDFGIAVAYLDSFTF
jgi:hypothetical protein